MRSKHWTLKAAEQTVLPEFSCLGVGNLGKTKHTEHLKLLYRPIIPEFSWLGTGNWGRTKNTEHVKLLYRDIIPEFLCLGIGNWGRTKNIEHLKLLYRAIIPEVSCLGVRNWGRALHTLPLKLLNRVIIPEFSYLTLCCRKLLQRLDNYIHTSQNKQTTLTSNARHQYLWTGIHCTGKQPRNTTSLNFPSLCVSSVVSLMEILRVRSLPISS